MYLDGTLVDECNRILSRYINDPVAAEQSRQNEYAGLDPTYIASRKVLQALRRNRDHRRVPRVRHSNPGTKKA